MLRCETDLCGQRIVLVPRTPGMRTGRRGGVENKAAACFLADVDVSRRCRCLMMVMRS